MQSAGNNLFSPVHQLQQRSEFVEVVVSVGNRNLFGGITYQQQRKFLCPRNTKIIHFKANILRKMIGVSAEERINSSYHMFYRNRLISASEAGTLGQLLNSFHRIQPGSENRMEIKLLAM